MSMAISPEYNFSMPENTGLSDVAKEIEDELLRLRKSDEAITIGYPLEEILRSLAVLFRETYQADWDGYGATAIPIEAFTEAFKLISLLPPLSIPMPEVLPEPGGEIGLEWYRGRRRVFVASVSGKRIINYAGIFGDNEIHGTEYFGESLPIVLMETLRRLYYQ